jgi:cytochrome c oxidase subunit 1
MNETLGKIHCFGSLVFMNVIFMPMFVQGLVGINRRLWDGGVQYAHAAPWQGLNVMQLYGAAALFLFQIPFIINFFMSIRSGKPVSDNPWDATTLEWSAPSPPPHGNFTTVPIVYRGPYEYSVPGASKDFSPQTEPDTGGAAPDPAPAHAH